MKEKILFWEVLLVIPSIPKQGTTCPELAAETQEQGVKTVQD